MKIAITLLLAILFFATSAIAGPPLVCHPFDIGNAKSLPWIGDGWNLTGSESYDNKNLAADTIAILDSDSTVLVHMETLRRATLYAGKDHLLAKQLLLKLIARANVTGTAGSAAALANFDAGYLAETYKQYQWITKSESNPDTGFDGFALAPPGVLIAVADAGGKQKGGVPVLGGQLRIGSFFQKKPHHRPVTRPGGAHQRRRAFVQRGVARIHATLAGKILGQLRVRVRAAGEDGLDQFETGERVVLFARGQR